MPKTNNRAPSQRQLRVGEEIRHALADIFERGDHVHVKALQDVALTVSEVRASPDLRQATVFVMRLGGGDMTEILEGLNKAKPYLRHLVGERIHTKYTPDLRFAVDASFDEAQRIDDLLHRPEVARDLTPESDAPADSDGTASPGEPGERE